MNMEQIVDGVRFTEILTWDAFAYECGNAIQKSQHGIPVFVDRIKKTISGGRAVIRWEADECVRIDFEFERCLASGLNMQSKITAHRFPTRQTIVGICKMIDAARNVSNGMNRIRDRYQRDFDRIWNT